jgi:hypothetical protein
VNLLRNVNPEKVPTSALSAAGLIAGFGVAISTGSRPLGGVVLAAFGLSCIWFWLQRDGRATAIRLRLLARVGAGDWRLAVRVRGRDRNRVCLLALVRRALVGPRRRRCVSLNRQDLLELLTAGPGSK